MNKYTSFHRKIFQNINFIIFFTASLLLGNAQANNSDVRSIMIGHLYPIMQNKEIVKILFQKIENINPDYIFVLGDSDLHDIEVVNSWRNKFGDKVFFAPGNTEIVEGKLDKYKKNVGYLEKVIEEDYVRFMIGNSNSSANEMKSFLDINKDYEIKPTILLIHHRIWDDTLTSAKPYQHDKSYYLKDIYKSLENNISTIFAGNSKHQYFYDNKKTRGNQNMNSIYWLDRIGDINAYSIGVGTGIPKLGFVEVISNKNFPAIVVPHHITTKWQDPLPVKTQIKAYGSIPPKDSIIFREHSLKNLYTSLKKTTKVIIKTGFLFMLGFISSFFILKILDIKNK